jgi:hypothetical protein
MRGLWIAVQSMLMVGVVTYLVVGSGCGAKSSLLYEDDEGRDPIEQEDADVPLECTSDAQCDDGVYCNGIEQCLDAHCHDGEVVDCGEGDDCHMTYCDEDQDRCVEILVAEDRDGDGVYASPCGEDCDDLNPSIYPGAPEQCNGVDDDCDGDIDEDLIQACEDFGRRVCRDGVWSECLECTVCIPGSTRYCDTAAYCSWGEQRCNDMGDGWGECYETSPAAGCSGYMYDQNCCMTAGVCCQDFGDWDGDYQYDDSVGACEDVICPAAP